MCLSSMSCCSGSKKRKTVKKITAKITQYREVRPQHYILANCSDNGDAKVKRADELPLPPSAMRLCLMDHSLDLVEIILVLFLQLAQLLLQRLFFLNSRFLTVVRQKLRLLQAGRK